MGGAAGGGGRSGADLHRHSPYLAEQDAAGANYMVTFDTDVRSQDRLYSTAIQQLSFGVVRTRLRALKAVVILGTCHSQDALSQTMTVAASVRRRWWTISAKAQGGW